MRRLNTLVVVLALFSLGGCALLHEPTPPPVDNIVPYHGRGTDTPPSRVVLMPLDTEVGHETQSDRFGLSLGHALAKRSLFETIPVSRRDLVKVDMGSARRNGTYRTEDLIEISKRFGADGALYGVVTHFEAYPAIRLGVRLYLVDCRSGQVPWTSEAFFDAADRRTDQDVHNYHDTWLKDSGSLIEYEKVLLSPRLFGDYAAQRIVATLESTLYPPRAPTVAAIQVSE